MRTVNRTPYQVDTPSSKDISNETFDNYSFTGIKEDKNFLDADQFSFAQSKNVYVDSDGLLRSRPAIKRRKDFDVSGLIIKNIIQRGDYYGVNYQGANDSLSYKIYHKDANLYTENVALDNIISHGNYLYLFTHNASSTTIKCFDKTTHAIVIVDPYIPITKVIASGSLTASDNEPKNALTSEERIAHLYSGGYDASLIGETVTVETDDGDKTFSFNEDAQRLFTRKHSSLFPFSDVNNTIVVKNGNLYGYFLNETDTFRIAYSYNGIDFVKISDSISLNGSFNRVGALSDESGLWIVSSGKSEVDDAWYINVRIHDFNTNTFVNNVFFTSGIRSDCCVCGTSTNYYISYNDSNGAKIVRYKDGVRSDLNTTDINGKIICIKEYQTVVTTESTVIGVFALATYNDDNNDIYVRCYSIANLTTQNPKLAFTSLDTTDYSINDDAGANRQFLNLAYDLVEEEDGVSNTKIHYAYHHTSGSISCEYAEWVFGGSAVTPVALFYTAGDQISLAKEYAVYNDSTDNKLYYRNYESNTANEFIGHDAVDTIISAEPLSFRYDNELYDNTIVTPISLFTYKDGSNQLFIPERIAFLSDHYVKYGNKLYVSETRLEDGKMKWYFPETSVIEYDNLVNMIPVSSTQMGVFTENGIFVQTKIDDYVASTGYRYSRYLATKTKMDVTIRGGSDVISTFDGTKIVFPTVRGLAVMAYQDFVSSTDQTLTFISDEIHDLFAAYNDSAIKLFRYEFWIFAYKQNTAKFYLYDLRNNSWWFIDMGKKNTPCFIYYNDKPLLLSNGLTYMGDRGLTDYFDDDDNSEIDWSFKSQKLHFGYMNHYKNVQNITLMTHFGDGDGDKDKDNDGYKVFCKLTVACYRSKRTVDADVNIYPFDVELIRSFVRRLNYNKLCEFEYSLANYSGVHDPQPLSLANITVKYRLGGQIR